MNILIGSQAIYCRNNFWGTALYFPELARKEIRLLWEFPNRVKNPTCYVGSMWHQLQHVYNRYTLKMVDKNSFQQYWSLWWGRLRGPGPWQSNNNHHSHTHPQPWELKIQCHMCVLSCILWQNTVAYAYNAGNQCTKWKWYCSMPDQVFPDSSSDTFCLLPNVKLK